MRYCDGCYERQLKIDRLKERIEHLEKKIKNRKQKDKEGYFGSSTPSAKKPFKENSSKEKLNKTVVRSRVTQGMKEHWLSIAMADTTKPS